MAIDYTQFAGETPLSLYAKNPNGLLPGWDWGAFDKANGTKFSTTTNTGAPINFTFDQAGQANAGGNPLAKSAGQPSIPANTQPTQPPPPPAPTTPPPAGSSNPIARPPGPIFFPTSGPGSPAGGTTLPGSPPIGNNTSSAQAWQNLLKQFFPGDQAPNEGRTFSTSGLDPRLDSLYSYGLNQALTRFAQAYGQQYNNGNPTVAQLTPEELAAQQNLMGLAGKVAPNSMGGLDYISQLMANATNPGQDPTLNAAISATKAGMTQDAFAPGGIFSQLRDQTMSNGATGSTRQSVLEALAGSQLEKNMANTEAQMRLQGRSENLNAANTALASGTPSATNLAELPASLMAGVGAQKRSQNQANLDALLQSWKYGSTQPDTALQNLFQLAGAAPLGGYNLGSTQASPAMLALMQSQATSGPSTGQNLAAILAGLGGVWSLFNH